MKYRFFLYVALTASLVLLTFGCGPDPEQLYNEGNAFLKSEKWGDAITSFDKIIDSDPDHAKAYNALGIAHSKLGNQDKALLNFDKALKSGHAKGITNKLRGDILLSMGQYERAAEDYSKMLEIYDNSLETLFGRAEAYMNLGKLDMAIEDLDLAITTDYYEIGKHTLSRLNRGKLYFLRSEAHKELGNPTQAKEDIAEACEIHEDYC